MAWSPSPLLPQAPLGEAQAPVQPPLPAHIDAQADGAHTHTHIQAHVTFFIRKVLKVPSSFHFGHPSLSSVSCRPFENLTGDSWLSPPDILIWHRLFRLAQKCSVSPSCTGQASLCWQSDTSRSLDTQAAALLGTQAAAQTRQSICATNKEVVQQFLGRQ